MINAIYKIGKAISSNQEPIDSLLKTIKPIKERTDRQGNTIAIQNYILRIIFDLIENKIIISSSNLITFDYGKSGKRFIYCGNNKSAGKQFYLTRELKSVKYLFGKTFSDLIDKIESEYDEKDFQSNNLYNLVKMLIESPLYDKENKSIKPGTIDNIRPKPGKIEQIKSKRIEQIRKEGIESSAAGLISDFMSLNTNEKIILVTPTIVYKENKDGDGGIQTIDLVQLSEYKELVLSKLKTNKTGKKTSKSKNGYCYLCKQSKEASSNYLKRIGVMKFFTTTAINSASGINKTYYDKNYRICSDCLTMLLSAEKYIKNKMSMKIAGTPAYVIPHVLSVKEEIAPEYFEKLHNRIDMAFNENRFDEFITSIKASSENEESDLSFSLNFLSYETDGNYFKVINHIHDVPAFYFSRLTKTIADSYLKYEQEIKGDFNKGFGLGSIYKLIPIKYKKDGKLSGTKNKALLFYSQLLGQERMKKNIMISYFCEAIYHLYMNQQSVYKNLMYYKEENFDFAIKDYFYRYLVLLRSLEKLNLLNKEAQIMEKDNNEAELSNDIEQFLAENEFNIQQRALFYLGLLVNQVAYSQRGQGHFKKPILKKISYQGMSLNDLKRLYVDVFEKLVQYNALYPNVEKYNTLCKHYFDRSDNSWELSEFENVFYLLSGYAYKVANPASSDDSNDNINEGGGSNE